jgi:MFS family permease
VRRFGGVRVSQCALVLLAAGATTAVWGEPAALLGAAMLIGAGYGLSNPAATAVLGRHVPVQSSGLFFSMKQAGVPIGVALAGLTLPAGLVWLGWRTSVALAAATCIACALWLVLVLKRLQRPASDGASESGSPPTNPTPRPSAAARLTTWVAPLTTVLRDPLLRRLGLLSLVYAMAQQCFVTFLVSLLHFQLRMPLAVAAAVLAASQAASTVARIGLGHASDRWMPPQRLLAALGLVMAACMLALAGSAHGGHGMLATAAALACAATAMGWNGVFFAALVRSVPTHRLADISGATQFLTFTGGMLGPFAASHMIAMGGSYPMAIAAAALPPAVLGWLAWRAQARSTPVDQGFR